MPRLPGRRRHGVEHVRIVAAIGAGLNEDEALEAEPPRLREIILERRQRRRIAKLLVDAAVGVAFRRPEHMEMRVAAQRRRREERFDATIVCQNDILDSVGRPQSNRALRRPPSSGDRVATIPKAGTATGDTVLLSQY